MIVRKVCRGDINIATKKYGLRLVTARFLDVKFFFFVLNSDGFSTKKTVKIHLKSTKYPAC
jgi:hypothetical protein